MNTAVTRMVASVLLAMIMVGAINSPDQIPGKVNKTDLRDLSGAIACENESNSLYCRFLTGAVVMNRLHSKVWNGDTIYDVIMAKDGGFIQYATTTRNNFRKKESSDQTKAIAKYLLLYYEPGFPVPSNVIYQGKNSKAGSGLYHAEPTPNESIKYEYFCYGPY